MDLRDLITPEGIIPALKVKTKKQALQDVSERAAALMIGVNARQVFEALLQRERLGSTGVGGGIAIPHGKIAGITKIFTLFARLEDKIEFESMDGEPVDLIFVLLAPESAGADHLKALARISRLLREPAAIEKLRGSKDRSALYSVLTEPLASHAT
jgi:PTS system nitrogen regulatory IIA component